MAVNLSLNDEEAQRLDQIAEQVTESGNRTEAVRRMMDVFECSVDIARERNGMDTSDDSTDINTSEPLSLEEAQEATKSASSPQEKTDILAAHIDHVSDRSWDRSELNKLVKSVLDCHRVTAYDYIDRLITNGVVVEGPLMCVDIDDVRGKYEVLNPDPTSAQLGKFDRAKSLNELFDIHVPDYSMQADAPAYWRQVWSEFGKNLTTTQEAFVQAVGDEAAVTYDEWEVVD